MNRQPEVIILVPGDRGCVVGCVSFVVSEAAYINDVLQEWRRSFLAK